jgi:type I restriction enzyme M protein
MRAEARVRGYDGSSSHVAFYGQEIDDTAWRLTKMNTVMQGIDVDLGVRAATSLREDMHRNLKAD